MTTMRYRLVALLAVVALVSACGVAGGGQPSADDDSTVDPDCVPGSVTGYPISQPDRRIEDIIEYLTGERQVGDEGNVEEKITDPIEVPYTWQQVEDFRDQLGHELHELGIESAVYIESTLQARIIEVHVTDAGLLPESFAPDVPSDAYVVVESPVVGTVPAAEEPGT